jgi:CelD/BcsL family acetyltransferase involved in cellulose biosynthesis
MNCEIIDNLADKRLNGWDALLAESANALPFQKIGWLSAWWDSSAAPQDRLFVILAFEGGQLVGIAPLMYRKHKDYAAIKFIGAGNFDYFDFIARRGAEEEAGRAFLRTIADNFSGFELELKNIFEGSPTLSLFRDKRAENYLSFSEDVVPAIELAQTKEKFRYQVKGALRWDVDRRERRLKELGELEFKACRDIAEAREVLEDFFALHIRKWEASGGYSAFKFKDLRRFTRQVLEELFPDKTMNLYYLAHNRSKNIAVCPAFEIGQRFIFYTHAYDPDFSRCSPGKVLIHKLINYSIDRGYREFDFGIGKEPYKLEWPCRIKKLYSVYLFGGKGRCRKLRRRLISAYSLTLLPQLRRLRPLVFTWRWLNRQRGQYRRFQ